MAQWIPLMEYASRHSVSLSTLRRYIKAKKVDYRLDQGKYFIFDEPSKSPQALTLQGPTEPMRPILDKNQDETHKDQLITSLQEKLRAAQEEIAELKTLVAFYEDPARPSQIEV